MPVVSRARLRQQVGLARLRDTYVGTTTFSPNLGAGSAVMVMNRRLVDTTLSGQQLGQNYRLRIFADEYRVASFNVGSGAYISGQLAATTVGSGAQFEVHRKVSSLDKDIAIDGIIGHLWTRQEVPLPVVDGRLDYSIGTDFKVFDAYYFANPLGSGSRGRRVLPIAWQIVTTATGRELRLQDGSLLGSGAQVILAAQVRATLGAADTATVNVPDEDWILNGVAARCYQTLASDAPGQEAGKYRDLAAAYAREFQKGVLNYRDRSDTGWRDAFEEFVA